MPCYFPVVAYRSRYANPETEKMQITFNRKSNLADTEIKLPCGNCEFCLKKKQDQWALRCLHESRYHEQNCFITLTYDDEHLPHDLSLNHADWQLFMKRFRKKIAPTKIKFFMCGEYGGLNLRPHFHALIFGYDFNDKIEFSRKNNVVQYTSEILSQLWKNGYHLIGDVHYGTAKYVAKYAAKSAELDHEKLGLKSEYLKASQGLGAEHAQKYLTEIVKFDNFVVNGYPNPVPKYYEKFIDKKDLKALKSARVDKMCEDDKDTLNAKRQLHLAKARLFKK